MSITPITLKGFRDFLPVEEKKRQYALSILKKVFESYGFEPLETPAIEYEDVLLGKYGDEGDKLMYRFLDNGERRVALRYDQTVPLARVVAQNQNNLPLPFKRYQAQFVWRAENTQKGRFREFLQCDIDTVGVDSALADAEVIEVVIASLKKLGFKKFKVIINDRDNLRFDTVGPDKNILVVRAVDKLKKIGRDEVIRELTDAGFSVSEASALLSKVENTIPTQRIKDIASVLEKNNIPQEFYEFSPTLARGLDYYTGLIIEVEVDGYTAGSIGGGGRYDNLIGMFAGKTIPAVGFAFGFDRLIESMEELKLFPIEDFTTKVLVTVFNRDLLENSIDLCKKVRAKGINCELWLDPDAKIDRQLKYADQKKIPYVLIVGPEEKEKDMVTVKALSTRTQKTDTLDNVFAMIE